MSIRSIARRSAAAGMIFALGACSQAGSLGNVLGSVLGGGQQQQQQGNQASGTIQGVDTRNQQIGLQLSNGQSVALAYDNRTQVAYENKSYPVTSLERGDQVTVRVQQTNNGGYYTDLVQVDRPVQGSASGSSGSNGNVQSVQGVVRQVDLQNGLFTMDVNQTRLTVSMPYSPSRSDLNRFQSLRSGDNVRIACVLMNNSRMELRQFY